MEPRPIAWVGRVAIVYVSDPGAELPLEHGVRPDVPQFATPHMVEPSFLIDLHTILAGRSIWARRCGEPYDSCGFFVVAPRARGQAR